MTHAPAQSHSGQQRTTTCRTAGCSRPATDGFVCTECLDEHADRLRDLPLLAHALEDRFIKAQRFSVAGLGPRAKPQEGDKPREDESPIPFDRRAGKIRRQLTRELVRWTVAVDQVDPLGYPSVLGYAKVTPTVEAMCKHLRRNIGATAVSVLGPTLVDTLRTLHGKALAAVDRPPDLVYLGICSMALKRPDGTPYECDEDLYAVWGEAHARCPGCKHQHDVKNRQSVLLLAVKDQLATASDIGRGLSGLDVAVTAERIRKWKERKRIVPRGTNLRGFPMYRVGDVIDLALSEREHTKAEPRNTEPRKAER